MCLSSMYSMLSVEPRHSVHITSAIAAENTGNVSSSLSYVAPDVFDKGRFYLHVLQDRVAQVLSFYGKSNDRFMMS